MTLQLYRPGYGTQSAQVKDTMKLDQALVYPGTTVPDGEESGERKFSERMLTAAISLAIGLLMLTGLLVSVPVLP